MVLKYQLNPSTWSLLVSNSVDGLKELRIVFVMNLLRGGEKKSRCSVMPLCPAAPFGEVGIGQGGCHPLPPPPPHPLLKQGQSLVFKGVLWV